MALLNPNLESIFLHHPQFSLYSRSFYKIIGNLCHWTKNNSWWWRKMDARFGFSKSHYLKFEYVIEKYRINIIFRSDLIKGIFLNNLNINFKYEFAYFFQFHGQILWKINCLTQIWYPFFSITHRFFLFSDQGCHYPYKKTGL